LLVQASEYAEIRMEFDFETWAKLARDDPEEFERRRRALVRRTIEAAPADLRPQLERLQFRIDAVRSRSTHPLGACVRLNALMWTGFERLRRELGRAAGTRKQGGLPPQAPRRMAEVIPFDPTRRADRPHGR